MNNIQRNPVIVAATTHLYGVWGLFVSTLIRICIVKYSEKNRTCEIADFDSLFFGRHTVHTA